ncbi:hypothetical protein G6F24_013920 [Rhizopus arrhizus]|nr:hypothetical protein G6F24_013920 [Rhizopus arrhizus]
MVNVALVLSPGHQYRPRIGALGHACDGNRHSVLWRLLARNTEEGAMSHADPLAIPVSPTRTGLRLLCVLCHKAGARIAQPVYVRRLPAPLGALICSMAAGTAVAVLTA